MPKLLDEKVATLHVPVLDAALTVLIQEHTDSQGSKVEGPLCSCGAHCPYSGTHSFSQGANVEDPEPAQLELMRYWKETTACKDDVLFPSRCRVPSGTRCWRSLISFLPNARSGEIDLACSESSFKGEHCRYRKVEVLKHLSFDRLGTLLNTHVFRSRARAW